MSDIFEILRRNLAAKSCGEILRRNLAAKSCGEILRRISSDSIELANRIEGKFYSCFESLGRTPGQGHTRKDLTSVTANKNNAVERGGRNVKRILKDRP